ncbi:MFS transporter [Boseaceae bacterium BT-24-1]|nr:MFS transporter [Boseaceae bacterium BT-24-1]
MSVEASSAIEAQTEVSPRTSYLVVALCWFGIFAEGYDVGVLGAILPALATDGAWNLTPIQLGALGSYTLIGMLIGGLAAGTISELYGRKPMFVACLGLFSACMVIGWWAPTATWFGISRFIAGLGLGGIIPIAAALTTEYSPSRRKSFNYGLMYSGYSLGILAAALVGRALLPEHGWRPVVLIGAGPLIVLPLVVWLLPESLEFLISRGEKRKAAELANRVGLRLPAPPAKAEAPSWASVLGEIFAARNTFATACFWIALFMGLLLVYGIA